jgi:hypothetical protein
LDVTNIFAGSHTEHRWGCSNIPVNAKKKEKKLQKSKGEEEDGQETCCSSSNFCFFSPLKSILNPD